MALLKFSLILLLCAVHMSAVRSTKDPNKKQLIVTSMPGGNHEEYNSEQLGADWNWKFQYFLFTYAMAAKRTGDEFMIFYPEAMIDSEKFDPSLFACSNAYLLPMKQHSEMDIWMRDFTAVNLKEPTHFKYNPLYLRPNGPLVAADFVQAMKDKNVWQYIHYETRLALDGGNVVDCEDKAIVSLRVKEENNGMSVEQIEQIIQEALPNHHICFIRNPPFDEDTTGHSDGVVSFLDKNTIILPHYGDDADYNVRYENITSCFTPADYPNLRIYRMNNYQNPDAKRSESAGELKNMLLRMLSENGALQKKRSKRQAVERFTSATGSTINLAMTDYALYVPIFESINKNNDEQYNFIKQKNEERSKKDIERVDTGYISKMGGSVRCLSWQQYANNPVATGLMQQAWKPKGHPEYDLGNLCSKNDHDLWDALMAMKKKK